MASEPVHAIDGRSDPRLGIPELHPQAQNLIIGSHHRRAHGNGAACELRQA